MLFLLLGVSCEHLSGQDLSMEFVLLWLTSRHHISLYDSLYLLPPLSLGLSFVLLPRNSLSLVAFSAVSHCHFSSALSVMAVDRVEEYSLML